MTDRIVIVRHGNTFEAGEPVRRIGCRVDLPLTTEGMGQAQSLGRWFRMKRWNFDAVGAGSLQRTMQTARVILDEAIVAPPVVPRSWLTEIDHGPDEGRLEVDVEARVGRSALARWEEDSVPPAGWVVDAETRIARWRQCFEAAVTRNLLVVTSSGAARYALLALPPDQRPVTAKLRTGAYGLLERSSERVGWQLLKWDRRPPD